MAKKRESNAAANKPGDERKCGNEGHYSYLSIREGVGVGGVHCKTTFRLELFDATVYRWKSINERTGPACSITILYAFLENYNLVFIPVTIPLCFGDCSLKITILSLCRNTVALYGNIGG